jgi:hypothetical protein
MPENTQPALPLCYGPVLSLSRARISSKRSGQARSNASASDGINTERGQSPNSHGDFTLEPWRKLFGERSVVTA